MVQHILVFGLRVYRWVISPAKNFLFGPLSHCRFTPSCSAYAQQAITRHGALRGSGLALKRICRCHPWGGCGDDPVPPVSKTSGGTSSTSPCAGRAPEGMGMGLVEFVLPVPSSGAQAGEPGH